MKNTNVKTIETNAVETKKRRLRSVLVMMMTIVLVFAMTMLPALAASPNAGDAIQGAVKSGLSEVYKVMTAIVVPIAVIAIGFAAFKIFTGGEKGMEQAKKIILVTIAGLVIVYLAPIVIKQLSGWFDGYGTGGVFD